MEEKHLIMGTAGHVDHGKTTLIKALTGYDCDTHRQEKKRGITINLGFTHLTISDNLALSVVDVPGHADFISTMIAGASGIDFVLFVISAEEGIMPQSQEHFEIMKMLDIQHGLIVLSKSDLVDEELIELAIEEVKEFAADSFLEHAPIIPVSATTGDGIKQLLDAIYDISMQTKVRPLGHHFRLYIDRIFTIEGHGTIVNGAVKSGQVQREQVLYLLPSQKEVRVRNLQKHGKATEQAFAGDRASLNLVGLRKQEFEKGMMLSDKIQKPTNLIDVQLALFSASKSLPLWSQVIFFSGTIKTSAKIHLLDSNSLYAEQRGLAQIYLSEKIIVEAQDYFIIRNSSGTQSIGGGKIIDPYPLHHRRRRESQIKIVKKIASESLKDKIEAEVNKHILAISLEDLAINLNKNKNEIQDELQNIAFESISLFQFQDQYYFLSNQFRKKYMQKIMQSIYQAHKENPFLSNGRTFQELMGIFGKNRTENEKRTVQLLLDFALREKRIKKDGNTFAAAKHTALLTKETEKKMQQIKKAILNTNFKGYDEENLVLDFADRNYSKDVIKQILTYLQKNEKIIAINKVYYDFKMMGEFEKKLITFLKENENQGISLAKFRDLIQGNRNAALTFLEYFDHKGITVRRENLRFLRIKS